MPDGTLTFPPGRGSVTGRVLLQGKPIQIADVLADPEYALDDCTEVRPSSSGHLRTAAHTPPWSRSGRLPSIAPN